MINYSIAMRGNPTDRKAPKKAFATAQYSQLMTLEQFTAHIASHGCVYSRADIQAIVTLAVDCMREQLLAGRRIQLGDLGVFAVNLHSTGAEQPSDFTSANITDINVSWSQGKRFRTLLEDAEFNPVPTRKAAALVMKALKAGETTVDLTGNGSSPAPTGENV